MLMRRSAVALIDGEHYPPVVVDALRQAERPVRFPGGRVPRGHREDQGAATCESEAGGIYGLPVVFDADWSRGLARVRSRSSGRRWSLT